METNAYIIYKFDLTKPFPVAIKIVMSESLANNLVLGMIKDCRENAVFYYSKECPLVR